MNGWVKSLRLRQWLIAYRRKHAHVPACGGAHKRQPQRGRPSVDSWGRCPRTTFVRGSVQEKGTDALPKYNIRFLAVPNLVTSVAIVRLRWRCQYCQLGHEAGATPSKDELFTHMFFRMFLIMYSFRCVLCTIQHRSSPKKPPPWLNNMTAGSQGHLSCPLAPSYSDS